MLNNVREALLEISQLETNTAQAIHVYEHMQITDLQDNAWRD